tara:strand:+ start:172 stop:1248 length:1077 start_codon:yes stop_codon:yes gene_type:complete
MVSYFYTVPKTNSFFQEINHDIPTICFQNSTSLHFYDALKNDILEMGINNICSNVLNKNCKLFTFSFPSFHYFFPTQSSVAHHLGAITMNIAFEMNRHPDEVLELLIPIEQRKLQYFEGFLHGALTHIACNGEKNSENRNFSDWKYTGFLNRFSYAPTIFWYNFLHGYGHYIFMKHFSSSLSNCNVVKHNNYIIPFSIINAAIKECSTLPKNHILTCVGGALHTFFEWSVKNRNFFVSAFKYCSSSLFPLQCFFRLVHLGGKDVVYQKCGTSHASKNYCDFALGVFDLNNNIQTDWSLRGSYFHLGNFQINIKKRLSTSSRIMIDHECSLSLNKSICYQRLHHEFLETTTLSQYKEMF